MDNNLDKELKPINFRKVISKPTDLKIIGIIAEEMNLDNNCVCYIALSDGLKRMAEQRLNKSNGKHEE